MLRTLWTNYFQPKIGKGAKKGKMLNVCLICSIKSSNCPLVRTEISISGIIHHILSTRVIWWRGPQLQNSFVQIAKYIFPRYIYINIVRKYHLLKL